MRRKTNSPTAVFMIATCIALAENPAKARDDGKFCQDFHVLLDARIPPMSSNSPFERLQGLSNDDGTFFTPIIFAPNARHCSISGGYTADYTCFWNYKSEDSAISDFTGLRDSILLCLGTVGQIRDLPVTQGDATVSVIDRAIILGPDTRTRTVVRLWESLDSSRNRDEKFVLTMNIKYEMEE